VEQSRPIIVGLAGGTASGKTTLAKAVVDAFEGRVALLHHDDYYCDLSHLSVEERAASNFERLEAIDTDLMLNDLAALLSGRAVQVPLYDFAAHSRVGLGETVQPRPIIIVDGLMVLAEPKLTPLLDLRVFVDVDDDTRFIRRLTRDVQDRGRSVESVIAQYQATVKPFHDDVISTSRKTADVVVTSGDFTRIVGVLKALSNA
jgi:uridine kinase